ncbi:MAG: DMT family transporter [Succinivibrionaceae bacterium]|nr:DMT family transporter [Succinivibrionaceae bacterium]
MSGGPTLALPLYVAALCMFGSNGTVAAFIGLSALDTIWWRTLLGALAMLAIAPWAGVRAGLPGPRALACLALSGAGMGLSWLFLFKAFDYVGVSLAYEFYYCGPILVIALAPLLFRERPTPRVLGSLALALLGLLLTCMGGEGGSSVDPLGIGHGLLAALGYALMVLGGKLAGRSDPMTWLVQLCSAFAAVALCRALGGSPWPEVPSASEVPLLCLMGIVNTAVAMALYFYAAVRLSAQRVSLLGYLELVFACGFAWIVLGERLTLPQALGAALIVLGSLLTAPRD